MWFWCDEGRFPGQKSDFAPGRVGSHLRANLLSVEGTEAKRVVAAARQALDDLQDYVDEISHEPWPGPGRPPQALVELREAILYCRYVDGVDVVLALDPIPLAEAP